MAIWQDRFVECLGGSGREGKQDTPGRTAARARLSWLERAPNIPISRDRVYGREARALWRSTCFLVPLTSLRSYDPPL